MTPGSHASPPTGAPADAPRAEPDRATAPRLGRTRHGWWRAGTPAVVLVCGALFVVSADNSEGTDLRPGRYTNLASLVAQEAERYERLQQRVTELTAEIDALAQDVESGEVREQQQRVERLREPAGLTPTRGSGLRIVLSDAPDEIVEQASEDPEADLREYVVHQQDIQAVVNALWRGGADAVMIQNQRIISTTGIKCEGNSVLLQGVPYPEPYVIEAVGDPGDLAAALSDDERVWAFRAAAQRPDIGVGWDLEVERLITAPAYEGLLDLSHARVLH